MELYVCLKYVGTLNASTFGRLQQFADAEFTISFAKFSKRCRGSGAMDRTHSRLVATEADLTKAAMSERQRRQIYHVVAVGRRWTSRAS